MAWSIPKTWSAGELANAARLNGEIRDRFLALWPYSAKGDIAVYNGSDLARVTVGANDTVLQSDNAQPSGVKWSASGQIPIGGIIVWSGSIASIPSGYALCNGASGTPDLRDRFIPGATGSYAVGATGGATAYSIDAHTHTASINTASIGNVPASFISSSTPGDHYHSMTVTTNTGNANSTTILPPYYALAYIMRVS